jgi:hypothetical protein
VEVAAKVAREAPAVVEVKAVPAEPPASAARGARVVRVRVLQEHVPAVASETGREIVRSDRSS